VPGRNEKKARPIVGVVLDAVPQYSGTVTLRRKRRSDCGAFGIAAFDGSSNGAGRVVGDVDV
jgi:hypothetical protein